MRVVHPDSHSVAGNPWLRHLEERAAYAIAIADANFIVGKTINCQILSEVTIFQIMPLKDALPISIRVKLVHHHRTMLTTMPGKIPLSVAIDIEFSHTHPAR